MPAPTTLVLAIPEQARRPTLADVGGALLKDKPESPPPKNGEHMYADMGNQWEKLLEAFGQTFSPAILTVAFDGGGVPFIESRATGNKALVNADFSVFDDGTGVTRIEWTSTKLPIPVCKPTGLTLHGSGVHTGSITQILNWSGIGAGAATPGTNRIIVTTVVGSTGAAANVSFSFQFN